MMHTHPELALKLVESSKTAKSLAERKIDSGPEFVEWFNGAMKITCELVDLVEHQDRLIEMLLAR